MRILFYLNGDIYEHFTNFQQNEQGQDQYFSDNFQEFTEILSIHINTPCLISEIYDIKEANNTIYIHIQSQQELGHFLLSKQIDSFKSLLYKLNLTQSEPFIDFQQYGRTIFFNLLKNIIMRRQTLGKNQLTSQMRFLGLILILIKNLKNIQQTIGAHFQSNLPQENQNENYLQQQFLEYLPEIIVKEYYKDHDVISICSNNGFINQLNASLGNLTYIEQQWNQNEILLQIIEPLRDPQNWQNNDI